MIDKVSRWSRVLPSDRPYPEVMCGKRIAWKQNVIDRLTRDVKRIPVDSTPSRTSVDAYLRVRRPRCIGNDALGDIKSPNIVTS